VNGSTRVYDAPVSRLGKLEFHRTDDGWMLVDAGVADGLFLNSCRVHQLPLFEGRPVEVAVGSPDRLLTLEVLPVPLVKPPPKPRPAADVVVRKLGVTTPEGRVLLDQVSFGLAPSSLTAVIGPSGAGKSTLLNTLSGQTRPTVGSVGWQGRDVHADHDELRFRIGFVPQEEILHQQLTVRQGLSYAAQLRLPPSTTAAEREAVVDGVIVKMGLERQADQRIGSQLSGGQRKRVSIATELLTAPPLLFLDEPTSGLDPGLDRSVMQQLRALADEGRVVVVATHSVLGLDVCDTIVVLARGGRVAFAGPPDEVLGHFGCDDYPQLFDLLQTGDVPRHLAEAPKASRPRSPWLNGVPAQSAGGQLMTLVRRNLAVLFADRLHLAMLLLMPLGLAALSHVVQGDSGLSLRLTRTPAGLFAGGEAGQRLTILIIAAALMGAAMTIREHVSERAIFRREYAVGLSPGLYFLSKVIVLGSACLLQGLVVTRLGLLGLPVRTVPAYTAGGGGRSGFPLPCWLSRWRWSDSGSLPSYEPSTRRCPHWWPS